MNAITLSAFVWGNSLNCIHYSLGFCVGEQFKLHWREYVYKNEQAGKPNILNKRTEIGQTCHNARHKLAYL